MITSMTRRCSDARTRTPNQQPSLLSPHPPAQIVASRAETYRAGPPGRLSVFGRALRIAPQPEMLEQGAVGIGSSLPRAAPQPRRGVESRELLVGLPGMSYRLAAQRRQAMPGQNLSAYQRFVLFVTCPKCHRGNGHYCRDEQGKCVPPHRERAQAALKASCATLSQIIPNRRNSC